MGSGLLLSISDQRYSPTTKGDAAAPGFDLFATKSVCVHPGEPCACHEARCKDTDLVRARHDETDHEHAANVEDEDTEERPADRDRDVLPRSLRLANCHTDQLGANVGEQRVGERAPETEENRQVVVVDLVLKVLAHGAVGMVPIPEAKTVMLGVTTEVDDDTHEQQADQTDDFDAAEPEFQLSEYPHTEQVNAEDCGEVSV